MSIAVAELFLVRLMTVRLQSSFLRSSFAVLIGIGSVTLLPFLWQGYHNQNWWSQGYLMSLLVPAVIGPVAVWLMFVPKRLEFTDTYFTIQFFLRRVRTLPWEELKYYGRGNNVFMIQFDREQAFQIFTYAFPKKQWRLLTNFLSNRYPERKASGWIGPFGFKWPWRRNREV